MMSNKLVPLEKGHPKLGGRVKGSRNKLSAAFLEAMSEAFEQHGQTAIEIVIKESPKDFLKVVASILPKEFEINDNRLKDIPDDELDALIQLARKRIANHFGQHVASTGSGEVTPLN